MSSTVAGIIQLIKAQFPSPAIKGISPTPVPDDAVFPYVTVRKILGKELESLSGRSGLVRTLMQVECWAKTYEAADALRENIKSYLLPFTGATVSGNIQSVNHDMDVELYNSETKVHQLISRFSIWWEA